MLRLIYRVFIFQLLFLFVGQLQIASAQVASDSLFVAKVVQKIHHNFLKSQKGTSRVFNGKVHHPHQQFKDFKHAYYQTDQYAIGSVIYDDVLYPELSLKYDILRDELILLEDDQIDGIVLEPSYVQSFVLQDQQFINIRPGVAHKGIKPGYYHLLYKGNHLGLLVKRAKEVTEKIDQQIEKMISQKDTYFLLRDSIYQPIKSKSDLLKLLRQKSDQNQTYIKVNKLNFGKDFENSVLRLVKFHDTIDQ